MNLIIAKIIKLIVGLIILSFVFSLIERKYKLKWNFKKPTEDLKLDLKYWLITPLFMSPLVSLIVKVTTVLFVVVFKMESIKQTKGLGFGPILEL